MGKRCAHAHLEELYGAGTFGFADQDENASLQVNGTILDLHTKLENGTTLIDDLHVDGTLSGDVQGTFGVVRTIEDTGMQANATGELFLVNVIFQESWFNITGINGGNFFDGAALALRTMKHGTTKPSNPTGTTERSASSGEKPARMPRRARNSQNGARFSKTQRHQWLKRVSATLRSVEKQASCPSR